MILVVDSGSTKTDWIALDKKGSINEFRMTYELTDNLEIMGAINKIKGNKAIENNQFSSMEGFSHIRVEVKYYY